MATAAVPPDDLGEDAAVHLRRNEAAERDRDALLRHCANNERFSRASMLTAVKRCTMGIDADMVVLRPGLDHTQGGRGGSIERR